MRLFHVQHRGLLVNADAPYTGEGLFLHEQLLLPGGDRAVDGGIATGRVHAAGRASDRGALRRAPLVAIIGSPGHARAVDVLDHIRAAPIAMRAGREVSVWLAVKI